MGEFMGAQASTEAMIADYKPRWVEDPVWGGLSAVTLRDKQQYLRKGIQNFLSEFERNYTVGASQFWLTMKMECQMYRTLAKSGETYVHKKSEFATGRTLKDLMDKFVAKLKQPQSFSYAMNLERPSGFNVVELGFEFYKDFKKVSAMKHMRDWSAHRAPLVTQGEAWEANRAPAHSGPTRRQHGHQARRPAPTTGRSTGLVPPSAPQAALRQPRAAAPPTLPPQARRNHRLPAPTTQRQALSRPYQHGAPAGYVRPANEGTKGYVNSVWEGDVYKKLQDHTKVRGAAYLNLLW